MESLFPLRLPPDCDTRQIDVELAGLVSDGGFRSLKPFRDRGRASTGSSQSSQSNFILMRPGLRRPHPRFSSNPKGQQPV
jgi:hypothetical protein